KRDDQNECGDTVLIENQKWHRVFGEWKCTNCQAHWKSGYVWILLEKFNCKANASNLVKTQDYFCQSCKKHNCNSKLGKLIRWKLLSKSSTMNDLPHLPDLCAKCKA
ncbi:5017_t:CDS:1, partial [Cetraspora pellucida]